MTSPFRLSHREPRDSRRPGKEYTNKINLHIHVRLRGVNY
jgi:hypothetical protein